MRSAILVILLFFFVTNSATVTASTQPGPYDVVVIGGTPAGVAAAIAAGRLGMRVILVEQAPVLGGVLSSGVNRLDDYVVEANSGVIEEFRQRVMNYHLTALKNDPVVKSDIEDPSRWSVAQGRGWEPKTAARIYAEMVAEVPGITTRFGEVPVEVKMKGDRIVAVITRDRDNLGRLGAEHRYEGSIIIDATYEGDVAAFAGVPFRIGREPRSREEPHAGTIYTDAFCGERSAAAMRGTIFPGSTGQGDNRTQAFTFRFNAKDYGQADHPHRLKSPPPGYNAKKYNWNPNTKPWLPNNKSDMLGAGDLAGLSTQYVLGDWEKRAELEEIYKSHELGWLYYIQTEGGSPQWGLADDEFTDNGNWPYRLYVRQGRRIEGLYTLTESDLHKDLRGNGLRGPLHQDAVAIGTYPIDSHNVQNPIDLNSPCGEGGLHLNDVTGPYQIPYGVMVPKNRKGLIVPVAISATHVAISSVRMEPVYSSLGQAAGVASALAVKSKREVSDVPVTEIQDALLDQGSTIFFYKDLPGDDDAFEAVQKLSLLGATDGDENYYFHPDQPVTLGQFARMIVMSLDIPLSITAAHFDDVPRSHPGFRFIETLYDYSTQSEEAFFSFEVRNYLNYWWGSKSFHGPPVYAYPEKAVTTQLAIDIIAGLAEGVSVADPNHPAAGVAEQSIEGSLQKIVTDTMKPDEMLTRGEAARLIYGAKLGVTK